MQYNTIQYDTEFALKNCQFNLAHPHTQRLSAEISRRVGVTEWHHAKGAEGQLPSISILGCRKSVFSTKK